MIRLLILCSLFISGRLLAQQGNFTFKIPESARTSAGVYTKDGTLVRTLWNDSRLPAGTHTRYWDGTDDLGRPLVNPGKDYLIKIVSNNVKYKWEGTIGNSSDSAAGLTKHRGYYHCMQGLAFSGDFGYFCTGYSEGSPSLGKFKVTTPNQKKQFFTSKTQTGDINFVATDDKMVYWGVYDSYVKKNSFVFATGIPTDKEVEFLGGSPYTIKYGKTYQHAVSLVNDVNGLITGLAVQKRGRYLFVARAAMNQLQVLNKNTGNPIATITVNNVRSLCVDAADNLWMVSGENQVAKYSVDEKGHLSEVIVSLDGLLDPAALQVSPDGKIIAVADGGKIQQVKFYESGTGTVLKTLGKPGGYFEDATVTDDKFYFNDARGKKQAFIAYQPNGTFWINDPGNFRVQHYDTRYNFINRIMSLGATYSTWVDKNNINRVWGGYLEFSVDYTVPLTGQSGWKLVKNWGANVSAAYDKSELFRYITTLSNNRTYGFLRTRAGRELVEFSGSGQLRFSGITRPGGLNFVMAKDGSIEQFKKGEPGGFSALNKYELTGFDDTGNPTWSSLPVTLATTPILTNEDPNASPRSQALTASGKVIIYAYNAVQQYKNGKPEVWATGYHLGAIERGGNKWLWKTELATHRNYKGTYPGAGYFDIGNEVNDFAGGTASIVDNQIITSYHGEFWKNGQTNKYNHYLDNGLAIAQFGITRAETADHATASMAGNALNPMVVKGSAGNLYLIHGDESDHAGIHLWKISGLSTIREQEVPLIFSAAKSAPAPIAGNLMTGLEYNSTLTNINNSGWSREPGTDILINQYNNIFSVTTNVLSYDRHLPPDLFIRFCKQEAVVYSVKRDLGKNNVSASWKLSGLLAYPNNMPNGLNIYQYLEVLDATGKVLTTFHVDMDRSAKPFQVKIYGNKKILRSGAEPVIRKAISGYTNFEVSMAKGVATFTYGDAKGIAVKIFDETANWRTPKTLRCRFQSIGGQPAYGATLGLKDLIFTAR